MSKPKFTTAEIDSQIRSMEKFASKGWAHGDAYGCLTPRGQMIQAMLLDLKRLSEEGDTTDE